jgi:hypothetical protein
MAVLTDLRNRGVKNTFFVVCDGLKGLPEVVGNVWPQAIVQTCIIHLLRNTFRLTSRKQWDEVKRDVKPIYTAVNATAAPSDAGPPRPPHWLGDAESPRCWRLPLWLLPGSPVSTRGHEPRVCRPVHQLGSGARYLAVRHWNDAGVSLYLGGRPGATLVVDVLRVTSRTTTNTALVIAVAMPLPVSLYNTNGPTIQ